jgi:hypothetical protein
MAITQAVCSSFKAELLAGVHNLSASGGDTFKIALFTPEANINSSTTVYAAFGEVVGTGYTAGGATLTSLGIAAAGTTAYFNFNPVSWPTATFSASGALIYNASKGNKAVLVLNFGNFYTATNSTFTLTFPPNTSTTALCVAN